MFLRDHLDDVCSDMSVFHRVDDILDLDSVTLWKLAWRLGAYQGRMAVIVQELQEQQESGPVRSAPYQASGTSGTTRNRPVEGTVTALRSHPEFNAGGTPLFEITEVPAST